MNESSKISVKGKEDFLFIWNIENLIYADSRKSAYLYSPKFSVKVLNGTNWQVRINPNSEDSGYAGLYLRRSFDSYPKEITVEYEFTVLYFNYLHNSKFSGKYRYKNEISYGWRKAINLAHLSSTYNFYKKSTLKIECRMWIIHDSENKEMHPETYELVDNIRTRMQESFPDFSNGANCDIVEKMYRLNFDIFRFTNHCVGKTEIQVEKIKIEYVIKNFSNLELNLKKICIAHSSREDEIYALLIIYLSNESKLQIDVIQNTKIELFSHLHCSISIMDSEGKVKITQKKEFYEDICSNQFSFSNIISREEALSDEALILNDELFLHFDFAFVKKDTLNWIEYSKFELQRKCTRDVKNNLTFAMDEIFNSRKHCDVILKTNGDDIHAHKAILCSRSPVLDAMMDADMLERNSNIINIVDIDVKTLKHMLKFMYTEIIDDMDLQEYLNLYEASDKYDILSLKIKCRQFLETNFSIDNVSDVLLYADRHGDDELKSKSISFLMINLPKVILSKKWERIVKATPSLANDVLLFLSKSMQFGNAQ